MRSAAQTVMPPLQSKAPVIRMSALENVLLSKKMFAKGSNIVKTECSSILDVCQRLKLINENQYTKGRELLLRIVAMLTKMGRAETAYTCGSDKGRKNCFYFMQKKAKTRMISFYILFQIKKGLLCLDF